LSDSLIHQLSFLDEFALIEWQQRRAGEMEILAVVVDPAAWPQATCGDHEENHAGEPANRHADGQAHGSPSASSPAKIRADARTLADGFGARHPVLLDPKGALPTRFGVEDLPAYVLIDAQGNLRRRFAGSRPAAVFEAVVNEAASPVSHRATAP
jgi:hypothetical protein